MLFSLILTRKLAIIIFSTLKEKSYNLCDQAIQLISLTAKKTRERKIILKRGMFANDFILLETVKYVTQT